MLINYSLQVVEIVEDPLPEEISLEIPDVLQQLLEKDCINIVHLNYSLKLPRNPNVCDILLQYYSHVGSKNGGKGDHSHLSPLREILDGLKTYFDVYLPVLLLYDEEKGQYKRECQDVEPSQIYGFEHLLRLFGKIQNQKHIWFLTVILHMRALVILKHCLIYIGNTCILYIASQFSLFLHIFFHS